MEHTHRIQVICSFRTLTSDHFFARFCQEDKEFRLLQMSFLGFSRQLRLVFSSITILCFSNFLQHTYAKRFGKLWIQSCIQRAIFYFGNGFGDIVVSLQ